VEEYYFDYTLEVEECYHGITFLEEIQGKKQ